MATVSPKLRHHRNSTQRGDYTPTPGRRYFLACGRLWRLSNPGLNPEIHARLVQELMAARRAVRDASDSKERIAARLKVDAVKKALLARSFNSTRESVCEGKDVHPRFLGRCNRPVSGTVT
jgi:hypothetical protein